MNQTEIDAIKKSNKLKLTWGLVCLIGPTALIVVALFFYAAVNFFIGTSEPDSFCNGAINAGACADSDPSMANQDFGGDTGAVRTITNVILFLVGATSVATWLPGLIVGIILIATRKPVPAQ